MDSLARSSQSNPPSTTLLCPQVRFLDQMDPSIYSLYFIKDKLHDLSLEGRHDLSPVDLSKTKIDMSTCHACRRKTITATDFWCNKCCVTYHKECVESPLEIKVPYHPKHPLQLIFPSVTSFYSRGIKSSCCGEDLGVLYYSCSICDIDMHPACVIRPNILSINYPKRHEHTLIFFPRNNSLTCDVCALGDYTCFIYICCQCDFVVHKSCIYLPTTIRISRHEHRISFTPSLSIPNKDGSCGVCRKRVDKHYGKYSCVKSCNYVVHSRCATRRDLWDGRELEGVPETEYGNIKSFEEISDGVIKHFSHSNHIMILEHMEDDRVGDKKVCQACMFPIYEGNMYSCVKCDFILHETCAYLPRIKWHQLHAHPLTLQVDHKGGTFCCDNCRRDCCGFTYTCCEDRCFFSIDVLCASVSDEPFVHELHPDPLFLTSEEGKLDKCSICEILEKHLMKCIKCSFGLCFKCATIPYKVKYRNIDEHYLTFFYEKDAKGYYCCEICETEIYPKRGFYTCNICNVTFHIECLVGSDPSMKSGKTFIFNDVTLLTIPNDHLTRPICRVCQRHSPYKIAFTTSSGVLFCSMGCIYEFGELWTNGKGHWNESIEYVALHSSILIDGNENFTKGDIQLLKANPDMNMYNIYF